MYKRHHRYIIRFRSDMHGGFVKGHTPCVKVGAILNEHAHHGDVALGNHCKHGRLRAHIAKENVEAAICRLVIVDEIGSPVSGVFQDPLCFYVVVEADRLTEWARAVAHCRSCQMTIFTLVSKLKKEFQKIPHFKLYKL